MGRVIICCLFLLSFISLIHPSSIEGTLQDKAFDPSQYLYSLKNNGKSIFDQNSTNSFNSLRENIPPAVVSEPTSKIKRVDLSLQEVLRDKYKKAPSAKFLTGKDLQIKYRERLFTKRIKRTPPPGYRASKVIFKKDKKILKSLTYSKKRNLKAIKSGFRKRSKRNLSVNRFKDVKHYKVKGQTKIQKQHKKEIALKTRIPILLSPSKLAGFLEERLILPPNSLSKGLLRLSSKDLLMQVPSLEMLTKTQTASEKKRQIHILRVIGIAGVIFFSCLGSIFLMLYIRRRRAISQISKTLQSYQLGSQIPSFHPLHQTYGIKTYQAVRGEPQGVLIEKEVKALKNACEEVARKFEDKLNKSLSNIEEEGKLLGKKLKEIDDKINNLGLSLEDFSKKIETKDLENTSKVQPKVEPSFAPLEKVLYKLPKAGMTKTKRTKKRKISHLHDKIFEMAKDGASISEISRKTKIGEGKVELIIGLQKKLSQEYH